MLFRSGIIWNDKDLDIDWELGRYNIKENDLVISEKDRNQQTIDEFIKKGVEIR